MKLVEEATCVPPEFIKVGIIHRINWHPCFYEWSQFSLMVKFQILADILSLVFQVPDINGVWGRRTSWWRSMKASSTSPLGIDYQVLPYFFIHFIHWLWPPLICPMLGVLPQKLCFFSDDVFCNCYWLCNILFQERQQSWLSLPVLVGRTSRTTQSETSLQICSDLNERSPRSTPQLLSFLYWTFSSFTLD